MGDTYSYLVQVRGNVDEVELNSGGPLTLKVEFCGDETSMLIAITDQAGMVGLMRYLNGLGIQILSVEQGKPDEKSF